MKQVINSEVRVLQVVLRWVVMALLVVTVAGPARAALGGDLDSVQGDQSRMKASVRKIEARSYTVHEMRAPFGTVVREYVSPAGRVFGVAWEGPFLPDMQQLLGAYFSHYSQSAKAWRQSHVGRQPLNIREDALVVQSTGHMRAYSGRAFDPGLIPEGVSGNDIR
jgi:hypothetical protein